MVKNFVFNDHFTLTIIPSFSGPARREFSQRFDEEFHAMGFLRQCRKNVYVHGQLTHGDMRQIMDKLCLLKTEFAGRANLRCRTSETTTKILRPRDWQSETKLFIGTKFEKEIAGEFMDKSLK